MNFSELRQIVLHKFIIPATLKVTAGVLVLVLSLTLLFFRELNAVQGLGVWRKPFLPPSCSSCVPGPPQKGLGLGFCSSEQAASPKPSLIGLSLSLSSRFCLFCAHRPGMVVPTAEPLASPHQAKRECCSHVFYR